MMPRRAFSHGFVQLYDRICGAVLLAGPNYAPTTPPRVLPWPAEEEETLVLFVRKLPRMHSTRLWVLPQLSRQAKVRWAGHPQASVSAEKMPRVRTERSCRHGTLRRLVSSVYRAALNAAALNEARLGTKDIQEADMETDMSGSERSAFWGAVECCMQLKLGAPRSRLYTCPVTERHIKPEWTTSCSSGSN